MPLTSTSFKGTAANDLAKHLDFRIEVLLNDFMDRCDVIGVDYERATAMALRVIGHYVTIAAVELNASEDEFMVLCRWLYQQAPDARR